MAKPTDSTTSALLVRTHIVWDEGQGDMHIPVSVSPPAVVTTDDMAKLRAFAKHHCLIGRPTMAIGLLEPKAIEAMVAKASQQVEKARETERRRREKEEQRRKDQAKQRKLERLKALERLAAGE